MLFRSPFLVEAIDPAQEAKLDGLNHAISTGSYLTESAGPVNHSATKPDAQTKKIGGCTSIFYQAAIGLPGAVPLCQWTSVPVLAADASPMQEAVQITEYRMPQSAAALVGGGADDSALARALPGMAPAARYRPWQERAHRCSRRSCCSARPAWRRSS